MHPIDQIKMRKASKWSLNWKDPQYVSYPKNNFLVEPGLLFLKDRAFFFSFWNRGK